MVARVVGISSGSSSSGSGWAVGGRARRFGGKKAAIESSLSDLRFGG